VTCARAKRGLRCALFAALVSGCTFEPGTGFATLDAVTLETRLDPGEARDLDGGVLSDLGYVVRLERLELQLGTFELEELRGSTGLGSGRFDPAEPPVGYSLCHGGHCHADDGRLVPYAEVEAELSGGGASFAAVVSLPVQSSVDLLVGQSLRLETVAPSSELPEVELRRAGLSVAGIELGAAVSGAALTEPLPFELSWSEPVRVTGALELSVDRDAPEHLQLTASFRPDGTLFDGVDFASLAESGELDDPDDETIASLLSGLSTTALSIELAPPR
jgi:hypothetical protein